MQGIEVFSLSNIQGDSPRLYAHAIAVLLFTVATWYYMTALYKAFISIDDTYKRTAHHQNKTVMVEAVPKFYRSGNNLLHFFTELYGEDEIASAQVSYNCVRSF